MSATTTTTTTLTNPTPGSTASSSSASSQTDPEATATTAPIPAGVQAGDISSPHQLIDWVDTVLGQLETRFDDMNAQVTVRMNEMSNRIDALESSIQDLIHGTLSPVTGTTNTTDT